MEDGFDAVSEGKLVHDLLLGLVEINLPRIFACGIWQLYVPVVLVTKVMEEVFVEACVLDVIGSDLTEERWLLHVPAATSA